VIVAVCEPTPDLMVEVFEVIVITGVSADSTVIVVVVVADPSVAVITDVPAETAVTVHVVLLSLEIVATPVDADVNVIKFASMPGVADTVIVVVVVDPIFNAPLTLKLIALSPAGTTDNLTKHGRTSSPVMEILSSYHVLGVPVIV
jgi:hypothetical protein